MENKTDKNLTNDNSRDLEAKPSHEALFMGVTKKVEKISMALYLVTDLIPAEDPIRKRIRECGLDLISESRSMSSAFSGDIYFSIAKTINKSWELISFLDVASSVGFVSDMNARILRGVLIELVSELRDKQKREGFRSLEDVKIGESLSDQISLSKDFFETKEKGLSKGQITENIKDKNSLAKKSETSLDSLPISETSARSNLVSSKPQAPSPKPAQVEVKKSNRKEKILDIIKEKGEVTVGDIMLSFPDVSSKTIQRELASLTTENILKREGDRRWSRYSLS